MDYLFLVFALCSLLDAPNVNGIKVTGLNTNITEVLHYMALKGQRVIVPNFLPDLTSNDNTRHRLAGPDAARRYVMRYIDELKRTIDQSKEFVSDDFTDYDEVPLTKPKRIGAIGELALRTIKEDFTKLKLKRREKLRIAQVKKAHQDRMNEIIEFMKPNYFTTMFLLDEVKRIKQQHTVIDPLRAMIRFVEDPKKAHIKKRLLRCFEYLKRKYKPDVDIWSKHQTNNLVINNIKDPYNYGFIN